MKITILSILFLIIALGSSAQEKESSYVNEMHIHNGAVMTVFGDLQNADSTLYNDGHLTMIGDSLINKSPMKGVGTLEMLGDLDQHITQKGIIIVDSLILDNRLDISFDNNITVDKYTAFKHGILRDNYDALVHPDDLPSLTFTQNAGYDTFLVRDESHVEGLVRKQGKTRFIFPIGDANFYRPAVADNIENDTTISAHYYYEWIEYPQEQVKALGVELYRDEYWYVSGAEKKYDLTLTYDEKTSTFDTEKDSVKIVSYDGVRETNYNLIYAESELIMSNLGYRGRSSMMDSSFVWYGFAKANSESESSVDLFIPQILSPNADGHNDKFVIRGLANIPENKLVIFNRYGDVLYEMENYDNSWNGTANQRVVGGSGNYLLPTGTYYVFFYDRGDLIYKDFVQLLRTD